MKYKVSWKIEGSYEITSSDLDLPEDASLEDAKEAIEENPLGCINPEIEGKTTVEVAEVSK